ncbi:putative ribonuclease H-like domain-containing protein [Tanacetum coccineum]
MTDYSLWEVILNGNKVLKRAVWRKQRKPRERLERTQLKQQYETVAGSIQNNDQTLNRLQKLIRIQLEIKAKFAKKTSTNSNKNNINEVDNTTYGVSAAHTQSNPTSGDNLSDVMIYAFLASQPNSPQLAQVDLEQIDPYDLEEMDLQYEMTMLTIKARRFIKRTCRKLDVNGQRVRFDRSKVECYNCHKNGHFTRECRAPRNQENRGRENSRRTMTVETPTKNALVTQDGIGGYDWSYQAEEEHPTNFALMAFTSSGSSSSSDFEVDSCSKSCVKAYATLKEHKIVWSSDYKKSQFNFTSYKAFPPHYTGNFIPSKPDLMFIDEIVESKNIDVITVVTPSNVKKVESNHKSADVKNNGDAVEPKTVRKNSFRPPVIEDWNSNDDSEVEFIPNIEDKTVRPSTKKIKFVKSAREIVEKELKYNLFSVSQICDKKNNVLFTDTECLVLSSDFKLLDESQVMLRVPRKDNIYSVDLKSVVLTGGLTCLIAKATIDESNTWHRRLGHINFKTMNKLVKANLVKGLPSKIFENDHSCVACQKGKQRKASYKTKLMNSISKPLHMFHMDLFGPTNVKSLMKKSNCLVVTDDFKIENQLDHKVKVIRSDNGTEFKNSIMNQFCEIKGTKREFSVARTPQQNGVVERKNRTLIEAARTILVDSKFPTTFWAKAVNTACYVLNRVLVIKPHNKTHYELIRGRPPLIDFMKSFGCPVTILNTRDYLGKFDGKANEVYFVRYSVVSKAMRVFNKRTRIVKVTLNIMFLENTTNVKGNGPDWLFDVDSLSISMNYVPVAAGIKTNGIAGTKYNIVAGPKHYELDAGMKPIEVDKKESSDKSGKHDQEARSE